MVNCYVYIIIMGLEIWEGMDGKVDGFICVVGIGGMFIGVGMFLKE